MFNDIAWGNISSIIRQLRSIFKNSFSNFIKSIVFFTFDFICMKQGSVDIIQNKT